MSAGVPAPPFKLNNSHPHPNAAPRPVGANTAAILGEPGYDPDRIAELRGKES